MADPRKKKMSFDADIENVQADKTKNGKVIWIAGAIAAVVIVTAACGAVYFANKSSKVEVSSPQNAPQLARTETGTTPTGPVPSIYDGKQVFVMYDPDCKDKDRPEKCQLVTFNPKTKEKVAITGPGTTDPDDVETVPVLSNFNAQVSPDGNFIAFVRVIAKDEEEEEDEDKKKKNTHIIMIFDRNNKDWKKLDFPNPEKDSFLGFTFDSKGIIYTKNDGNELHCLGFTGNEASKNMVSLTQSKTTLVQIRLAVFLQNETLVFSIKSSETGKPRYTICMKNGHEEPSCWKNEFSNPMKFIPCGNLVYGFESDGTVWKWNIDTSDSSSQLESFKVTGYRNVSAGTISDDGKSLYLSAYEISLDNAPVLVKVDIEGTFSADEKIEIEGKVVMPLIGNIAALVPVPAV